MPPANIASHFAELLDALPDVLAWMKDRQGRYLWVNRAFRVQHSLDHPSGHEGASVERILGKTDYELSPAFLADQYRLDDEQVLEGHRIVNRLERVEESRGTTTWHVTDKVPVVDAKGAIIGTAGMTRTAGLASSVEATAPGFGAALAHMQRPFPARDHQSAPRGPLEHVASRLRAAVPCRLSSHPPALPAQASPADCQSRAGLYRRLAVRHRLELRLCRSEPFVARIPASVRPHPPRLSRPLQGGSSAPTALTFLSHIPPFPCNRCPPTRAVMSAGGDR